MPDFEWWVDEPIVMACSNPSDQQLARLRALGFSVLVSLLEEKMQPPRYDKKSAALAGWAIHSIPIEEGGAPSLDHLCRFTAWMKTLPEGAKVLIHCESGLGRSAFMGAVYWIAKGLPANDAIARVGEAGLAKLAPDWNTPQREVLLHDYARLQQAVGTNQ
jgi:protein-tyrosine phosphatase